MEIMKDNDSNTLARIDERTQAHTIAFALHVKEDAERFDRVFHLVSERFDKLDGKLSMLWDDKNKRSGAFNASKLLTGGIWAVIVLAVSWFINKGA